MQVISEAVHSSVLLNTLALVLTLYNPVKRPFRDPKSWSKSLKQNSEKRRGLVES